MYAILERLETSKGNEQTPGVLTFYGEQNLYDDSILGVFYTLELGDKGNKCCVSRINADSYTVTKYSSEKYKDALKVNKVEGRVNILIHFGNFFLDIEGCILVGDELRDVNNDGLLDVLNSKRTLRKIMNLVRSQEVTSFELIIINK